jgi:hypothetical protein
MIRALMAERARVPAHVPGSSSMMWARRRIRRAAEIGLH